MGKKKKRTAVLLAVVIAACCFRLFSAASSFPAIQYTGGQTADAATSLTADELELYAASAVLMDGGSGRILYDKEGDTPLPMASTTKIMTCILALEWMEDNADAVCTASANASAQPQVKLGMVQGEEFYMKDLLYSLMLESHNDTAVCIAETVAGSVENFAAMMNAKAEEIGCTQTYYITPNGLDAEDENGIHHTTARDLALVMRYCLTESSEAENFLTVTRMASYSFTDLSGTRSYSCTNHNVFLNLMAGALSGKTGFTSKAGYCYVGALEQDGKLLIVALLACGWPNNRGYKWADTKKLMNYGLSEFELRDITESTVTTADIPVTNGQQDHVATAVEQQSVFRAEDAAGWQSDPEENLSLYADTVWVLMCTNEEVEIRVEQFQTLEAPVQAGEQVGLVHYLVDGIEYAAASVVTAEAVKERTYLYCLRELTEAFLF
ncbi:MAG: D-alanyl-D-alanine carboxypeptidase [Clostridiales bacterium]|nr:D-alanyl-D-alanine carboxypeptidase [Clostridiales bacterium]